MSVEEKIAVLSFYSFVNIAEPNILLSKILYIAKKKYIRGTVLIAHEGFNGTISGELENVQLLIKEIEKLTNPKDINIIINYCHMHPFSKIKVKIKREIVAMKSPHNLDIENLKGKYIEAHEWDQFISQDDVIVIDTRNDYEVKIGTFKNSINPKTETFRQLPQWINENIELLKGKKVAMFCTGGIRCEKSTAALREKGISDVYHLKRGILGYLEATRNQNQMWQGKCLVFDHRGAVSEDLSPSPEFYVKEGQTAKSMAKLA